MAGGDRLLAPNLYEHSVPLIAIENALLLAAARRLFRSADASLLPTIRSLAYFSRVMDMGLQGVESARLF